MKKRIVVLEDNKESRAGMAALLRSEGHEVMEVGNALEAQACVIQSEVPPDIALIDIDLPGLRGDEWALYLKAMMPETQIIFVSGTSGVVGIDQFGPDAHFFHKPFSLNDFLRVVNEASAPSAVAAATGAGS